jgi:hypothetical protein
VHLLERLGVEHVLPGRHADQLLHELHGDAVSQSRRHDASDQLLRGVSEHDRVRQRADLLG